MPGEATKGYQKKILSTLGDAVSKLAEIKGELSKIREAVTEGVVTLREAIHENTKAQAELKMMERVVEVRSILPQIEAEQERVEVEQDELDRQLDRIAERYERKHDELDEKAAARVRDLGAHIFEIDEEQFEDGIEAPFAEHVTTAWRSLQAQNDTTAERRRERVVDTTGEVVSEIYDFVDQQRELVDRIEGVRTDVGGSLSGPATVQLPYYVVTTETGGRTERHVVVPSRTADADADGHCTVSLEPLPGLERVVSPTDLESPATDSLSDRTVRERLEPYIEEETPLVSYGDAVESAVDGRIETAAEGGE